VAETSRSIGCSASSLGHVMPQPEDRAGALSGSGTANCMQYNDCVLQSSWDTHDPFISLDMLSGNFICAAPCKLVYPSSGGRNIH
jgi:hypothetical protein